MCSHCVIYSPCSVTYLRLQHDLCKLSSLLSGETVLLELLKAVSEPLPLLQAAQLAGLY